MHSILLFNPSIILYSLDPHFKFGSSYGLLSPTQLTLVPIGGFISFIPAQLLLISSVDLKEKFPINKGSPKVDEILSWPIP